MAAVVTILDAPRTYRKPGWGWFWTLTDYDREDVCFGRDPHIREELEQLEQKRYAGLDYPHDSDRVKALEEILEPSC